MVIIRISFELRRQQLSKNNCIYQMFLEFICCCSRFVHEVISQKNTRSCFYCWFLHFHFLFFCFERGFLFAEFSGMLFDNNSVVWNAHLLKCKCIVPLSLLWWFMVWIFYISIAYQSTKEASAIPLDALYALCIPTLYRLLWTLIVICSFRGKNSIDAHFTLSFELLFHIVM